MELSLNRTKISDSCKLLYFLFWFYKYFGAFSILYHWRRYSCFRSKVAFSFEFIFKQVNMTKNIYLQ